MEKTSDGNQTSTQSWLQLGAAPRGPCRKVAVPEPPQKAPWASDPTRGPLVGKDCPLGFRACIAYAVGKEEVNAG